MNNNINYISKCLDLRFCLNQFITANHKAGKDIYILHLDSTTTDRELFINKIYKNFRDRVLANAKSRFNIEAGVGGVEMDSNGYWHIHLLVTKKKNYCTSSIYNHSTELRKLWFALNEKYTGSVLKKSRYKCELVDIDKKSNLTKYISKPVKHHKKYLGKPDYLPKGFNTKSSFRCTLGKATKYWCKKDMPSWKKTDKQIINSLKSVWNEYYKIEYLPTLDLRKREFETLVHSECTSKNKQEKTKRNKTMNETQEINNGFFVESESENYNTNENLTPLEQVEYGKAGLKFQMEYVKWHSNRIKELDVLQITDTTPAIDLNSPMVRKDLLKHLLVRLPYSERLTKRLFQDKIGIRYESKSKTNWFKY